MFLNLQIIDHFPCFMKCIVHNNFLRKNIFLFIACVWYSTWQEANYKSFFDVSKRTMLWSSHWNIQYPTYFRHSYNTDVEYSYNSADVWSILKSISPQSGHKIPTWALYNTLLPDGNLKQLCNLMEAQLVRKTCNVLLKKLEK